MTPEQQSQSKSLQQQYYSKREKLMEAIDIEKQVEVVIPILEEKKSKLSQSEQDKIIESINTLNREIDEVESKLEYSTISNTRLYALKKELAILKSKKMKLERKLNE